MYVVSDEEKTIQAEEQEQSSERNAKLRKDFFLVWHCKSLLNRRVVFRVLFGS